LYSFRGTNQINIRNDLLLLALWDPLLLISQFYFSLSFPV
jgi:hypothetical protein